MLLQYSIRGAALRCIRFPGCAAAKRWVTMCRSSNWRSSKGSGELMESEATNPLSTSVKNVPERRSAKIRKRTGRDDKVSRMGTASIPRLIVEFAIPSILGMLVNGAYNVIDSVFLGQAMGEIGLATATVGHAHHDGVHGYRHARGQRRQRAGGDQAGRAQEGRGGTRDGQQLRAAADRHGGAVGHRHLRARRPSFATRAPTAPCCRSRSTS